jgi:hypothetical protein
MSCNYVNKRASYYCDSWKPLKIRDSSEYILDEQDQDSKDPLVVSDLGFILPTSQAESKLFKQLESFLDSALNNDLPVPKDLKIDDSDFPVAKNFYDFCTNEKWGFKKLRPLARQLWMAIKLFGEYCPDCTKKRSGDIMRDYHKCRVGMHPERFAEKVVLLEHGKCPICKHDKIYFYKQKKLKFYSELAVCAGQRAGKSIFTGFLFAYVTHRYLKLQKPAELMTGIPTALLVATFVSIDMGGAMRNLWIPFTETLEESKWFNGYHDMLKQYKKKHGEEFFKHMDTFLTYNHRRLSLLPQVPNVRGLRGATRYMYALDELGWFDANSPDKITISAQGVYTSLNRSLLTARDSARDLFKQGYMNIPSAYAINVSSPSASNDKIMELVSKNRHSKTILALHAPTWELNPKFSRKHPEIVTAYENDPIGAERDYGANPPINAAPFITDETSVERAFSKVANKVTYTYETKKSKKEDGKIHKSAIAKCFPNSVVYGSVLAIDAGYSDNSFSICVGHREDKMVIFDALVEVMPEKGKTVLNHARISKNVVEELIRQFNVKYVLADRWNSLFLLHKYMEDFPNLTSEQYSVKYDDFILFKSYMEGERIKFPKLETKDRDLYREGIAQGKGYPECFDLMPSAHLYHQMLTVQDKKRTVEKGSGKTDDLFRAAVLATTYLLDDEIVSKFLTEKRKNGNRGIVAIGTNGGVTSNVISNSKGKGIAALG